MSWKLRYVFVALCIGVVLYLGFKRDMLVGFNQEYIDYQLVINEVMTNNRNSIRDGEGDFEDWIEIYNGGKASVNLQNFGLSNEPRQPFLWTFPNVVIEPESFCIVWISGKNKGTSDTELHASFKLKSKDKAIILTAPNNDWKDIFVLGTMGENISYGRVHDGGCSLYGFDEGTPSKSNDMETLTEGPNTKRLSSPTFSHSDGFYTKGFSLTLSKYDEDTEIYYTLDGSIPTKKSIKYTESILIPEKTNAATVVRVRAYKEGYPKSKVLTQSYFVEKNIYKNYNVPVISLVIDPDNLFDYEKGIYIAGKIFDEWIINNPNSEITRDTPANYNQKGKNWEREASVELIEPDGVVGLTQKIGISIHGGTSRAAELKTLSLKPSKDYDDKDYFDYDFFNGKTKSLVNNKEINQFSRILLRASATDRRYSLFRDALIQSLIETPIPLDTQSSKASILYINGEYYGIHNIREAYDSNYLSHYYHMDPEDVVIIKNPTGYPEVEIQEGYAGDEMDYNQIIKYIKEHGVTSEKDYEYIKTKMDVDNFIEYNVLQIYCDNDDWPGNNVRIWRKRTQTYKSNVPYGHDGRWRWLTFDLDHGFGLYQGEIAARNNSIKRATEENGPIWPNPPWSTFLLRSLLENDEFKSQFINIFADRLNTIYSPEVVVDKIETMEDIYYPNIESHIMRWNLHGKNVENWKNEVEVMKKFALGRPSYIYQHILDYFGLTGTATIRVETKEGGKVRINSVDILGKSTIWKGTYFTDVPITVQAIPSPGFVFVGWDGVVQSEEKTVEIYLEQDSYLKADFKKVKK
ncbi:CotH kinase family protein [Tissierella sp.]|uniref:CotH kinase family protein n=1 Tax=Tissierella sp. TaxID=41274 RepID=UPI00285F97D5|nr:CotH kinase family protein [Tissierella sp.]MDR7855965.1 CotH kinase family protein [Tissierella sp.]